MSYILDALKKSEAERNRGISPNLFAATQIHVAPRTWFWVALAAVAINLGFGVAWILWRSDESTPKAVIEGSTASRIESAHGSVSPPLESISPRTGTAGTTSEVPADAASLFLANTPEPTEDDVQPSSTDLNAADFPFSTHIYSDDPAMRAVTLNGRRLVEGDAINQNVTLRQITETGVILDINGRRVTLEVLQDWR